MEDFGYSKQKEESAANSAIKRAFLIGATLFSIACFFYVTINAYYFFSQNNNANIETIKAEADPIKIVEVDHNNEEDAMKIDSSIYEDIFGNHKNIKEKEVRIRESDSPAIPPKTESFKTEKTNITTKNDDKKISREPFVSSTQKPIAEQEVKKQGQIIVYSDSLEKTNDKAIIENSKNEKRTKTAPAADPHELVGAIIKPTNTKKPIRVQIAALTSRESANDYWSRLQKLHPSLFSGLKSFVEQVDLGKRGMFYRLQIGNFFDQIKAEEFCNKYVNQSQKSRADCIVVE